MEEKQEILNIFREVDGIISEKAGKLQTEYYHFTLPQLTVLSLLHKNGMMRISDLAMESHCAPSTISGIIDRLERDKFVNRTVSAADRRVILVDLTPQMKDKVVTLTRQTSEALLQHGSKEELGQILSALRLLRAVVSRD